MDARRVSAVGMTLATLLVFLLPSDAVFVFKLGRCPNVGSQPGFDRAKFSGIWYEYKRFPTIFEAGMDCSAAIYGDAGDRLTVVNEGVRRIKVFNKRIVLKRNSVEGFATVANTGKDSELNVSFGGVQVGGNSPNFFIQATDYDNYAVVFSCAELPGFNIQFAWILTRVRGLEPTELATLEANLALGGVDLRKFKMVDQKDCDATPPSGGNKLDDWLFKL